MIETRLNDRELEIIEIGQNQGAVGNRKSITFSRSGGGFHINRGYETFSSFNLGAARVLVCWLQDRIRESER